MESQDMSEELRRIQGALLREMQRIQDAPVPGAGIQEFHQTTKELMMGSPVVKEASKREGRRIALASDAPGVATFDAHPHRDGGLVLRLAMFVPDV